MPSLIDMRRRIRAVKSTQQITKAMKMVAASKLRRAQERVVATRPFATRGAARAGEHRVARRPDEASAARAPAGRRDAARRSSSSITSDRGLCGSFNTNIIKAVGGVPAREPAAARCRWAWSAARAATSSAAAGCPCGSST